MVALKAFGLTDVGLARSHNEDFFKIDGDHCLYVVADGMGGHNHGEVASRVAVGAISSFVRQASDRDTTWPLMYDSRLLRHSNVLKAAIRLAHDEVLGAIRQDGSLFGMGTTVVGCLVEDGTAAIAHVGDSRAYRWRDGELRLMTNDHTWVNEQVEAGYLSEEQARAHPLKNVVTRALGGDGEVIVDVVEFDVQPGDRLLLCSDGLTTMLDDHEIEARLSSMASGTSSASANGNLNLACHELIRDANARGGFDNITVLLVDVSSGAVASSDGARSCTSNGS